MSAAFRGGAPRARLLARSGRIGQSPGRMFTGLVIAVGDVQAVRDLAAGRLLTVGHGGGEFSGLSVGDSVAVSGVCLTAVSVQPASASFEVAAETLSLTTLGDLRPGNRVNLELPLRASDRLGGHFVQGHVDGCGEVIEAGGSDDDYRLSVRHREPRWIVRKGSVAIDGVSLTVAAASPGEACFDVMLIPHTRAATTLGALRKGDRVNVEYDILAKYVGALLQDSAPGPGRGTPDEG
ncbi:MAG: riboflavin synthase [Acidobacteria bacterium]|nr:riboflavin synthase [Acidobacteriota bacterium]